MMDYAGADLPGAFVEGGVGEVIERDPRIAYELR